MSTSCVYSPIIPKERGHTPCSHAAIKTYYSMSNVRASVAYLCSTLQLNLTGTNQQDLSILYSNRAASFLKDGNCAECVKDCTV